MDNLTVNILGANFGKTCLYSVGQAGFIVKSKCGQLLGVDLYLSECVERLEGHTGFKRLLPKILMPFDLEFDCLITTHPHWDHFDMDSVPQMMSNNKTRLFASVNCALDVKRLGMKEKNISYVKPGDKTACGDFLLEFVACDHGTGAPDAVGVIVTVDDRKIYFAGDTCLRLDHAATLRIMGPVDVMIAPINGAYGNLNEQECAQLSGVLCPKVTVPCHYGMFASHGGNPGLFKKIMDEQYPDNAYLLMAMGECFVINEMNKQIGSYEYG